jgi:DNA-binding NarL/FixJ family response regulator
MNIKKIKVIIADDHNLFRDGLKMLLHTDDEIEVVAEACNGKELIELSSDYKPDVVITDLSMPGMDGLQAIRLLSENKSIGILAITTFDTEYMVSKALEAGALGFIVKNAQDGEVIKAVKAVNKHQRYHCKSTAARLATIITNSKYDPELREVHQLFSEKEKELIRLICEEKSNEEIGKIMFMSKRTVEGIRSKILVKMNVKTAAGVALYAVKNALFFLETPGKDAFK